MIQIIVPAKVRELVSGQWVPETFVLTRDLRVQHLLNSPHSSSASDQGLLADR